MFEHDRLLWFRLFAVGLFGCSREIGEFVVLAIRFCVGERDAFITVNSSREHSANNYIMNLIRRGFVRLLNIPRQPVSFLSLLDKPKKPAELSPVFKLP